MLGAKTKAKLIEKFKGHDQDTGSTGVQIAILSERITSLTAHLRTHPKDNHSRKGLLAMVARRRKLLEYLKRSEPQDFGETAKKLGAKR